MIKGIGIDLVEIERIKKGSKRLAFRVLTEKEMDLYESFTNDNRKVEFLAGRFAAKEAYSKACGTGIGDLSFQDIEVLNDKNGKPYINNLNENIHISITHTTSYAEAIVIIEKNKANI